MNGKVLGSRQSSTCQHFEDSLPGTVSHQSERRSLLLLSCKMNKAREAGRKWFRRVDSVPPLSAIGWQHQNSAKTWFVCSSTDKRKEEGSPLPLFPVGYRDDKKTSRQRCATGELVSQHPIPPVQRICADLMVCFCSSNFLSCFKIFLRKTSKKSLLFIFDEGGNSF